MTEQTVKNSRRKKLKWTTPTLQSSARNLDYPLILGIILKF